VVLSREFCAFPQNGGEGKGKNWGQGVDRFYRLSAKAACDEEDIVATEAIQLTANALKVLERRYLKKDHLGRVAEKPAELFRRVADAIARPDLDYGATDEEYKRTSDRFFRFMTNLEFMPNSPTLMNAGRPLGQLSACFVLPVGDSMEEIFEAIKHAALIHKSGGGTGFAFSRLRPRNSVVASTSGVASGPVSFMRVFNSATEAVKQGGTRRGANMGILRVDHPDIVEFISCKDDTTQITNFNISVAITDEFMRAAENGESYALYDPRTNRPHEQDGVVQTFNAREVFNQIISHAWKTGEPGIVFLDRINDQNPTKAIETIEATNPCGEQPLPAYDSCNLASLNLGRFIRTPLPDNYHPRKNYSVGVDWEHLVDGVRMGVHFLDNVIDANKYPIPEIAAQTKSNRRIGLGVMGWADMLVQLGIPYGSEESMHLGEQLMERINTEAHMHSSELAKKRGKFPNWDGSIFAAEGVAMRNATVTTIAPTGTISILAGCASGIEPYFAVSFVRNVMEGTKLLDVNPHFEKIARERGFYSEELMEKIAAAGSIKDFAEVPQDVRDIFLTSADISPEQHIRMQAVFQKHCDSAVSKTINLPNDATTDDVQTAYWLAYRLGCKGVTIYRDGSRPNQVLSTKKEQKQPEQPAAVVAPTSEVVVEERPDTLRGITEKIKTGYGNLYVTINMKDDRPFEVFATIGKSGYSTMADTEAICRMISLMLRSNIPVRHIIDQLQGIGGASPIFGHGEIISSIPDAIAKVLKKHFGNGMKKKVNRDIDTVQCPDCGGRLEHKEGCVLCPGCGFSRC